MSEVITSTLRRISCNRSLWSLILSKMTPFALSFLVELPAKMNVECIFRNTLNSISFWHKIICSKNLI